MWDDLRTSTMTCQHDCLLGILRRVVLIEVYRRFRGACYIHHKGDGRILLRAMEGKGRCLHVGVVSLVSSKNNTSIGINKRIPVLEVFALRLQMIVLLSLPPGIRGGERVGQLTPGRC